MFDIITVFKPKAIHGSIIPKIREVKKHMNKLMEDGYEPYGIVQTPYGERHYFKKNKKKC